MRERRKGSDGVGYYSECQHWAGDPSDWGQREIWWWGKGIGKEGDGDLVMLDLLPTFVPSQDTLVWGLRKPTMQAESWIPAFPRISNCCLDCVECHYNKSTTKLPWSRYLQSWSMMVTCTISIPCPGCKPYWNWFKYGSIIQKTYNCVPTILSIILPK